MSKKGGGILIFFHLCSVNLVIDIGNTRAKAAVFEQNRLVEQWNWDLNELLKNLSSVSKKYPNLSHFMMASVGNSDIELMNWLQNKGEAYELNAQTRVPFKIDYQTPQTLGVDRIAVVAAAYSLYPNTNCLIIDAGSCITYEFLTAEGVYKGGAIAPGLQMRFNAVHQQTAKLPLLTPEDEIGELGSSTQSSIQVGIIKGLEHEISGWIQQTASQMENLTVILTGGDTNFLSKRLKNTIFAHPNFVLQGINYILEYNKQHA